jgi:hypothetical protein|tara:strand:- start:216 stop:773 length:558 start_codon:yes stop_codon:yes gene_type:complete
MSETDAQILGRGSIENMDPFAYAPPGHSLTQDNSRWPWGKPPRDADPEVALKRALDGLEEPSVKEEMMKLLMVGVSVEVLVEGFLLQGFQEGKFTPDVALLMKPVLGLMIAEMAEDEGVPFRLFENDDAMDEGKMDDTTFFRMMRDNNPRMFEFVREKVNAEIRKGSRPLEPREGNFLDMKENQE